jgi:N-methylhydantoinase B
MSSALKPSEPPVVDPVEREIFRYTALSITEELEVNITRTAYSPLIQESQDYCIALVTPDFRPFMQSEASIPIMVTDMGEPVRDAVSVIGVDELEPGDVFAINYGSGQHLNNTVVATPLYHGDRLTGYLAIRAHWADVGGMIPGGQAFSARSIFHEGTRYRGLRIMRRGRVVPEVMATIQANTYQKEALTGDIMAQLAACLLGAQRWQERVVARWDADQVRVLTDAQLAASAAYARRAIAALPDGEYRSDHRWHFKIAEIEVDLKFALTITIQGDRMVCDLSGMPPQTTLPINAGRIGGGMAAARLAFRYLVGGDAPTDAGFFSALDVVLPEGTIVSATGDAPMGFWNMTMPVLIDMFIRAIGNTHPDLVPASSFGSVGGLLIYGRRDDGGWWRTVEGAIGGLGGEQDADGYGPVKCLMLGNMKGIPVEMAEARYPIRYNHVRLNRETGGAGRHRGGPGVEREIQALSEVFFDAYPEPSSPAPGLAGGEPGKVGAIHYKTPDSEEWRVPGGVGSGVASLPAGTLIRQMSGGGGGWGTPAAEAPQQH